MLNKRRFGLIAMLLTVGMLLVGCFGDDPIDIVKDGSLYGYEQTSVGRAFDTFFKSPKWHSFETANGTRIVEFTGILKDEYAADWGLVTYPKGSPFLMQFTIMGDEFEITYAEAEYELHGALAYLAAGETNDGPAPLSMDDVIWWLDLIYNG